MKHSRRFLLISVSLVATALVATVLVWLLLQNVFLMQQEHHKEMEPGVVTNSTAFDQEGQ